MKPPIFIDYGLHISGVIEVVLDHYQDKRGINFEGYNQMLYLHSPNFKFSSFSVDSFSYSKKGVLRGFHGDGSTVKLIQCLYGEIFLVVIDMRESSPTKGNVLSFNLGGGKFNQVLVPAGCVNAHQCVSEECLFSYKLSVPYVPQEQQIHVKWNDPQYNIQWPIPNPILSERDSNVS